MRAVASTSPLGASRFVRRASVSGSISTAPRATARRSVFGLRATSTMCTSPASVRWFERTPCGCAIPGGGRVAPGALGGCDRPARSSFGGGGATLGPARGRVGGASNAGDEYDCGRAGGTGAASRGSGGVSTVEK